MANVIPTTHVAKSIARCKDVGSLALCNLSCWHSIMNAAELRKALVLNCISMSISIGKNVGPFYELIII